MLRRIFLIFSLILLIGETFGNREPCRPPWTTFQDGCYAFNEDAMTWEEAKEYCKKNRAHLVDIKSKEENNYVGDMSSILTKDFWIGVRSEKCKDGQKWWLTSGEQTIYTGWEPQQPNTVSGDESCVRLDPIATFNEVPVYGWKNLDCNEKLPSACKYYRDPCEEGFSYFNGSCYTVEKTPMSWNNARLNCQKKNSELADFNSVEETKFIKDLAYVNAYYVYIGITDICHDGNWKNIDGTKANFLNWKSGQPNGFSYNEFCATLDTRTGQWDDALCEPVYMSVCKYNLAQVPPPQDDE